MPGSDHDSNVGQFEERLRTWGGRPPSLTPSFAASRVISQLPADRRAGLPWLRLAAVAAMLVLITVTAWIAAPSRSEHPAVAMLGSDQIVQFWLDSDTPVYFVLPPFGGETGDKT